MVTSLSEAYRALPQDDDGKVGHDHARRRRLDSKGIAKVVIILLVATVAAFALGFAVGRSRGEQHTTASREPGEDSLLPPQSFIPEIPTKEVVFQFPTKYEDTGPDGDRLWDALMPIGAGFVRVPYPRRFDMPASEPIKDDKEQAELYSLSITHQLHCLAVLREVIIKYEKHDKSRFAGDGHEYHCLDYIRQAILCAGDTTLDYGDDQTIGPDGEVTRYGFTGANSTHQCRDWEAIRAFAEMNKSGDRVGIL